MRIKSFVAALGALFFAGALAAQTPATAPALPVAPPPIEPENSWILDLSNGGRVTIQLRPDAAPNHVERIKTLTRRGFYDGLAFHRVIEGFMAQGGDPKGDGTGGSELPDLEAEFNVLPHVRGAVAAARSAEPNSANSQFYIMFAPRFALDNKYTVFGRVTDGMDHVDRIARGEPPASPTRILQASIGADNRPPPNPGLIMSPAPGATIGVPGGPAPVPPQPLESAPQPAMPEPEAEAAPQP